MILQKFIFTIAFINQIQDECFNDEYLQGFNQLLDNHNFEELDYLIDSISNVTSKSMKLLSEQESIDNCFTLINEFTFAEKFALHQYLTVGALYKEFHVERLPLFPIEKLAFNFFAYLESAYENFRNDCLKKGLSVAEEVFALSLDNLEQ